MILRETEREILKRRQKNSFVYPDYDEYCISNVFATGEKLLGAKTDKKTVPLERYSKFVNLKDPKNVVVILLDGFGYDKWLTYYKGSRFMRNFTENGAVGPLTTVFPSTTAAGITSLVTGSAPGDHGMLEWLMYVQELNEVIYSLLFTTIDKRSTPDSLLGAGVDPRILHDGKPVFKEMKKNGIDCYVFSGAQIAFSAYNSFTMEGSKKVPYESLADMIVSLRKCLQSSKGKSFFYVYIEDLEHVAHSFGPHSEEYKLQLSMIMHALEEGLLDKVSQRVAEETLVLVTADHGHLNMDPKKEVSINKYKKVMDALRVYEGRTTLPWGGRRDLFLHVKPELLDETQEFLSKRLRFATVLKTEDLIKHNAFGSGKHSKKFFERVGNLTILPHYGAGVSFEYKGRRMRKGSMPGMHGGLSKEEMLIPLAIARLSDL